MNSGNGFMANIGDYLTKIRQPDLLETLTKREEWSILLPITPQERALMFAGPMPMAEFRNEHWNKAFGGDPLKRPGTGP